jgi:hypothetical protein
MAGVKLGGQLGSGFWFLARIRWAYIGCRQFAERS